jgi:hypothetical protein
VRLCLCPSSHFRFFISFPEFKIYATRETVYPYSFLRTGSSQEGRPGSINDSGKAAHDSSCLDDARGQGSCRTSCYLTHSHGGISVNPFSFSLLPRGYEDQRYPSKRFEIKLRETRKAVPLLDSGIVGVWVGGCIPKREIDAVPRREEREERFCFVARREGEGRVRYFVSVVSVCVDGGGWWGWLGKEERRGDERRGRGREGNVM